MGDLALLILPFASACAMEAKANVPNVCRVVLNCLGGNNFLSRLEVVLRLPVTCLYPPRYGGYLSKLGRYAKVCLAYFRIRCNNSDIK